MPWVIPFVLDPDTSEPLPRTGRQTGRAAVYDILLRAHWGGVISGDEVTIDWDLQCPCGRSSVAFEKDIIRYSEKQGSEIERRPHHLCGHAGGAERGHRLHEGPGTVTGAAYTVPLFLRGQVIVDDLVSFGTRDGAAQFQAPDMAKYVERLPLKSPGEMADLYDVGFDEILDVLEALGDALDFDTNTHLQEAYEASLLANVLPAEMMRNSYRVLRPIFSRQHVLEVADTQVGLDYLNGWVPQRLSDGRELRVRAFGSRVLHIPAGNGGLVSAVTILRSVIARCDTIIKAPSNDPLTAIAIARTLADVAPDHPITRHLVVGYWKGGDLAVEDVLYQPRYVEKIVAWGGLASVKHVTRYIQPGLELIALDPKRSATIIGAEAFTDEATMREVAQRAAIDIGVANQEGCANARVIYALVGNRRRRPGEGEQARRDDLPGTHRRCRNSSAPRRYTPTVTCSSTSRRRG